jgi:signal transduction histidine kinase
MGSRENTIHRAVAALVAALSLICCVPAPAFASCFSELLGGDAPFDDQIEHDPKAAITRIAAALAGTESQPAAGASRAHLYAMLMDADENAGDIAAARLAAARGLESLTAADGDGLRRRLQLTGIMLLEVEGHLEQAAAEYEKAAANIAADAPDLACVLGDRGYLRYLVGGRVDAAVDAMRAYRLAGERGRDKIRLSAGQLLARLYSQYGLYDQALGFADEAVDYYQHSDDKTALSDAYLFRGDVFLSKEEYAPAQADFLQSKALLQSTGDRLALSFTLQRLCTVAARMPDRPDAAAICHDALELASAVSNGTAVKLVLAAQARIKLGEGRTKDAIELWDRALADDGTNLPKRTQAVIYSQRGKARANIGDAVGALQDMIFYAKSLEDEQKSRSADQAALVKVVSESILTDEELARTRAEARAAELTASRQILIRDLVTTSAIFVIGVLSLGMWSWHRRKLAVKGREAAEERLAAIGRLIGGIAHDFNNLLCIVQLAIGSVARRESVAGDGVAGDSLEQARLAAQDCADITAKLLSFARQDSLQPEALEMGRYLKDLRSLLERTVGSAIALRIEVQEPAPVAWVDRRQLSIAFLNLAANSRDAMARGGTLTVRVCSDFDGRVRIDVKDEGGGMPPEVLAHAIEPFYSTKPVGHGSGLGLSMVEGFAAQSGGSFAIVSAPNRGTTASLWLPAADKGATSKPVA